MIDAGDDPLTRHVRIPLADGAELDATLYLPIGIDERPQPCLLEALPYRKDDLTSSYRPEYLRFRDEFGYPVARVDLRGTGSSDGLAVDEYPISEQRDLAEVIDWLAGQPWCSGSVGMFGTSYSGFNSIQLAMERPPALKAIVATYATDDRYTDDVHYMGGALRLLDLVDYPVYMAAMNALPPVPARIGDLAAWRRMWLERLDGHRPWLLRWVAEQVDGPYWRHGSLRPGYDRIEAATMLVAGWADGYRNNTFRTLSALTAAGVPARLVVGPWSHADPATALPGPRVDLVPELARWWDRWLRGIRNGIDAEPSMVLFARQSTRPEPDLRTTGGRWRSEAGWPPDRATRRTFRLGAGRVDHRVLPSVGTAAWNSCAGRLPWGQPLDQRFDDAASHTTDWPVGLDGPVGVDGLEILGHPVLRLRVAADQPVAFVSAKLCEVFGDGTSALVTRGLLNLTHRDGHATAPRPLVPGELVDVEVELEATSWTFTTGNLMRLSLAGTDWPNTVAPPRPVTLTFDLDGSELELPVVDGAAPIPPPALVEPVPGDDESEAAAAWPLWRIERDVLARTVRAVVDHGSSYDVPFGGTASERYLGAVQVDERTFGQSATASAEFTVTWPEASVRTTADLHLRTTETDFEVEVVVEAFDGDQKVSSHRWDETIPRVLG